jgi:hypothetical protein
MNMKNKEDKNRHLLKLIRTRAMSGDFENSPAPSVLNVSRRWLNIPTAHLMQESNSPFHEVEAVLENLRELSFILEFKVDASIPDERVFALRLHQNFKEKYQKFMSITDASSNKVEEVVCVQPKEGEKKFSVVVNGNYSKPLEGNMAIDAWKLLFEVTTAGQDGVYFGDDDKKYRSSIDYLNSNKNHPFYKQVGCEVTKILERKDGWLVPAIKVELIAERAYKIRLTKFEESKT